MRRMAEERSRYRLEKTWPKTAGEENSGGGSRLPERRLDRGLTPTAPESSEEEKSSNVLLLNRLGFSSI